MKKLLKNFLIVMLLTIGGLLGVTSAHASSFNFSVNPILPDNQVDKNVGYFDLLMTPGQKQTVEVAVSNSTDKEVTVEVGIAPATTNINGTVEYSPNDIKPDPTLKHNMKDLAITPGEIKLAPKSSQTVKVDVTMPNEAFKGIIAGGITFKQKSSETDTATSDQKGVSIKNEYAFAVGLLMRQNPERVSPDLTLNNVFANQVNARNVISANLQNKATGFLNQMIVNAHIKGITDTSVTFNLLKSMMQMAPNTNFDLPIPVSIQGALGANTFSEPLKAGKYHLSMVVNGQKDPNGPYKAKDEQGKEETYLYQWKFERDFEITGAKADELNKLDVTIKQGWPWWYWLLMALAALLVIFFLFFILWKRRKKDEEEEEEEGKEAVANEKIHLEKKDDK
ncbi:MAG: DUF916 and DUF3324 domain-containing protein [Streptococcaceae bacterium]|jgi:hypothetical protein|nr:DUF916 and DUF3324 domain-containing protein [Streptococcaceae bacterium]